MRPTIIISAGAAFVIYSFTSWLKGVSFWYFAGIFALAIVVNIIIHLIAASRLRAVIERQFWTHAEVLLAVLIIGCVIAINWPESRLGGGILFIFAVVSWVGMLIREILG